MNNTNNNAVYYCGVCGKRFKDIESRNNCEMACLKKQKEEEKKAAEAKKNAEKDADLAEASSTIDNAYALINKCIEKYGAFRYNGKLKDLDALNLDFFPSKLWHHFWF